MSNPKPSTSPGSSKKSSSLSPAKELEKLTASLALAGAANKKLRSNSHSPTRFSRRFEFEAPVNPMPVSTPSIRTPTTNVSEDDRDENPLKEERIYSYDYFQYRIPLLYRRATHAIIPERVIVLFTASDIEGGGPGSTKGTKSTGSWCKECNYLESIIAKFKAPKNQGGYFVRVTVGTLEEWTNPNNPFRLDRTIRLESIPTIIVWGTSEKLAGKDIFDVNQLVAIFDDSIRGDPWRSKKYRSSSPSSKSQSNRFS